MRRLLFLLLPLLAAFHPAPETSARRHDVHVSNGRMAVEGNVALVQVRLFKDDLTQAFTGLAGRAVTLAPTPEMDALATRYLNRHLLVNAGGRVLVGRIVGSEEDDDMWAYQVEYRATAPIRSLVLTNTLLFDLYDDQRNLFRVMFFPSVKTEAFYFVRGAERYEIRL